MKHMYSRVLSVLLMLVMVISIFAGTVSVSAASTNTATRHKVCTQLSSQAKSYYTGQYTYATMSKLNGGTESCLQAVNSPLYKSLHTLMTSTMTNSVSYRSLTSYWDETDNNLLIYSDKTTDSNISREHVWPKSRASFYQTGGGSDLHHLRPENTGVNSARSNYTMGNVRGVLSDYSTYSYGGKTVLYLSKSDDLVEVNDNIKGDVARIFLYVYVRWEEPNLFENTPNPVIGSDDDENNGKKVIANLDTLLQWCEMDPVDEWEMRRNDLCQDVQHNRNIFIDYPEYAWLLFGREIPTDMVTPSGEAANSGPQYTITARSNNTDYGTVSLNGKTITATPKTDCEVSGYEVTPADAATVTQSGNVFTVSNVKADCTVTILFTYVCKHEHTHTETVEPTCAKEGAVNIVCDDCGAVVSTTPIAKTRHDYADTIVAPTCESKGYTLHTCKNCGESYKNTYVTALGHNYVSKVTKPATETEDGVLTYTCTRCDSSYTEVIPATAHDCPCDDYSDLDKTEWYHEGVDLMLNMGYMNGIGGGKFDPEGTTTRAMIVTILWRIAGEPSPEAGNTFSDVAAGQWYSDAITWAAENDVVNGIGGGKFDPEGKITREQMATILFRYAGSLGADTSKRAELSAFPDGSKTADWATDAVQWAVAEKIINGSEGKLLPQDSATRAQVATILYRSMDLITE